MPTSGLPLLASTVLRTSGHRAATSGCLALRAAVAPSLRLGAQPPAVSLRFASNSATAQAPLTHPEASTPPHFKDSPPHQHVPTRPHEDYVLFHPVYTKEELSAVQVVYHEPKGAADKLALWTSKLLRFGFDVVTRYKHPTADKIAAATKRRGKEKLNLQEMREEGLVMKPEQWMARILFLESVAGVPGMVAAMLRHFKSLRMAGRDGGWIHSLLEEAENERMHLLTFMKIRQPGIFFKALVFGAQGVFANLFFLTYLISPRSAHRFVGNLEEEAVYTYSLAIKALEGGELPEWENVDAPNIAKDYWRMDANAKMLDLLYVVRSDEVSHRFTNHTLANIGSAAKNPFGMKAPPASVQGAKAGFTVQESEAWAKQVEEEIKAGRQAVEQEAEKR